MADNNHISSNEELELDLTKLWHIIWHRKYWILLCYLLIITSTLLFTLTMPKKYESSAKILVNKGSSTNLADINPFIISDMLKGSGGISGLLGGGSPTLNEDIALIKSPLVLDKVIKENNLKYLEGEKAGQYISFKSLVEGDLDIEASKDANIIELSYKSRNPEKAAKIISDVINSYKYTSEIINLQKARKDREFLEKFYTETKQEVEEKADNFKDLEGSEEILTSSNNNMSMTPYEMLLMKSDNRLKRQIGQIPRSQVENKKKELDLEAETTKLKLLKEKYEWSILVENMARNASKVIVLEAPIIPDIDDNTEPKIFINILISLVLSFTLACCVVLLLENASDKLVFSDFITRSGIIVNKVEEIDISKFIFSAELNNTKKVGIIALIPDEKIQLLQSLIEKNLSGRNIDFITSGHILQEYIDTIKKNELIIFITQIEYTTRKTYLDLSNFAEQSGKIVLETIIINKILK